MHQHKEFAAGDYKTPQGAAQIERQWIQLQAALDELGPHRTVEQWKICWRDQKRKARVEGGALTKIMNATGNRSAIPELSETSAIILDTIGKEMALGCGPAESPIGLFLLPSAAPVHAPLQCIPPLPVTCTITSTTLCPSTPAPPLSPTIFTLPSPPSIPSPPFIPTPPSISTLPPPPSFTTTFQPPSNAHAPKATRRRVRASHPPDRFLNAQNELNALIRELTNVVRRSNSLKERSNSLKERSNSLKEEQNHILNRHKQFLMLCLGHNEAPGRCQNI
ncbi:hypothetical protein ABMA27_009415 [Loxostege sticticalis]|uniref:Nuclear apoptosis-inducing factor 1 n=1 Tax=Loxostege sticticalis TaxID=481309 RepID=A0ABR3H7V3_LOXSC